MFLSIISYVIITKRGNEMKKIIEAYFDNDTNIQRAISALEKEKIDINKAEVYSGGETLGEQTYNNTHEDVLTSATGFVYNSGQYSTTLETERQMNASSNAIFADGMTRSSYFLGSTIGSNVPNEKPDISGDIQLLHISCDEKETPICRKILKKYGATRIKIKS